jgi:hypothetical protein
MDGSINLEDSYRFVDETGRGYHWATEISRDYTLSDDQQFRLLEAWLSLETARYHADGDLDALFKMRELNGVFNFIRKAVEYANADSGRPNHVGA